MLEGINIKPWPVYGLYLPDAIHYVRWNGQDYVITANEGDNQEYEGPVNFTEEIRGKSIDSMLLLLVSVSVYVFHLFSVFDSNEKCESMY